MIFVYDCDWGPMPGHVREAKLYDLKTRLACIFSLIYYLFFISCSTLSVETLMDFLVTFLFFPSTDFNTNQRKRL